MTIAPPLVAPFVGEHFSALHRLRDLLAPPYDVIAEAERVALASQHEHNIVHLILPQGNADRYAGAAARLDQWRRAGVLVAGKAPAVYVVEQEFTASGRAMIRTGLIGAVVAEPFERGRIRPHERTHAGPKQDRLALMRATRTMFESLLMLARDKTGALGHALAAVTHGGDPWAVGEVRSEAVRVWRVDGPGAQRLAEAAGRDALYIADGHHRFETAVAYREEFSRADRTLALIISLADPGLVVLPTHRIIYGRPLADAVSRLRDCCQVEDLRGEHDAALDRIKALGGGCVVVLPGGRLIGLTRRSGADPQPLTAFHPAVHGLDVAWADAYVVPAVREEPEGRLGYSSDAEEVIAAVQAGSAAAGVVLSPPAVADVLDVADAGGFMPQKSTYFIPKVPSGLIMLPYDDP